VDERNATTVDRCFGGKRLDGCLRFTERGECLVEGGDVFGFADVDGSLEGVLEGGFERGVFEVGVEDGGVGFEEVVPVLELIGGKTVFLRGGEKAGNVWRLVARLVHACSFARACLTQAKSQPWIFSMNL